MSPLVRAPSGPVLALRALAVVKRWSHSFGPSYVPVVVVGAGPTGLVLSCLLSQYGIHHMVLERSLQLTQHPQAHYINNRTMEVFRGLGDLAAQVKARSPPLEQWRRFIYCEAMANGQLLGQVDHFPGQTTAQDLTVSPEPVTHLSQHRLLPLLLQQAQQLSAANGNCADIRFGSNVTAISNVEFPHRLPHSSHMLAHKLQQQPQQSTAAVAATSSGHSASVDATGQHWQEEDEAAQQYPVCVAVRQQQQQPQQGGAAAITEAQLVRCSYLVAADGAHSTVRHLLEIPLEGEAALQHLVSIHFSCPALGRALLQQQREAMLYFVFNRQLVAVLVAHDLAAGEFVAQVPYYPPLQSATDFTSEVCQRLIAHAAGWSLQQLHQAPLGQQGLQLHSVKNWVMSAVVAQEYSAWNGNILLAGDAAHRFPPAGGFGMNTGIQDAHDLAWKLAAVLAGAAHPQLVASYEAERRPVALANTALSVNNWHEAVRVPQALGLDPAAANLLNQVVAAAPVPESIGRWLLDSGLAVGRHVAAAVTPLRKAALQEILTTGQSLRLQFPKEDLGVVYTDGAVAADIEQQKSGFSGRSDNSSRGGPYVPSIAVGGRLPHVNLTAVNKNGQHMVSSLDLVSPDRLGLNMLLICSDAASNKWIAAGQQLQQQGWPLHVLHILPQGSSLPGEMGTLCTTEQQSQLQQQQQRSAFGVDVDGTWARLHSGYSSAAVLVRPDGHIAWSKLQQQQAERSSGSSEAVDELRHVLQHVLHLQVRGANSS